MLIGKREIRVTRSRLICSERTYIQHVDKTHPHQNPHLPNVFRKFNRIPIYTRAHVRKRYIQGRIAFDITQRSEI